LPCILPSACQGFERFDETERLKPLNLNDSLVHFNNFGGDLETYTCIYWTESVEEPNQEQPILFSATANVCQVRV